MEKLFIGSDQKLRPWIQLVLIYMGTMVAQFIVMIPVSIGLGIYLGRTDQVEQVTAMLSQPGFNSIMSTVGNGVNIIVTLVLYKFINKRSIKTMGLTPFKKGGKQFVSGLVLGSACIVLLISILTLTGSYRFKGFYITSDLLVGLLLFIAVGFGEEILVRGAFQHIISEKHSIGWAIFIPSILFSAMHLGNPNVAPLAVVNLFLAGIVLGVITYTTGSLWMAIGWHITWNFTMGNLFGIEVSGLNLGKGLIQMERIQDNLLNGGNFGLEGGYLCSILLCMLIGVFIWRYNKHNDKF